MSLTIEGDKIKVSAEYNIKDIINSPTIHTRIENELRIVLRQQFSREIYDKINSKMQDIIDQSIKEVKIGE